MPGVSVVRPPNARKGTIWKSCLMMKRSDFSVAITGFRFLPVQSLWETRSSIRQHRFTRDWRPSPMTLLQRTNLLPSQYPAVLRGFSRSPLPFWEHTASRRIRDIEDVTHDVTVFSTLFREHPYNIPQRSRRFLSLPLKMFVWVPISLYKKQSPQCADRMRIPSCWPDGRNSSRDCKFRNRWEKKFLARECQDTSPTSQHATTVEPQLLEKGKNCSRCYKRHLFDAWI